MVRASVRTSASADCIRLNIFDVEDNRESHEREAPILKLAIVGVGADVPGSLR